MIDWQEVHIFHSRTELCVLFEKYVIYSSERLGVWLRDAKHIVWMNAGLKAVHLEKTTQHDNMSNKLISRAIL